MPPCQSCPEQLKGSRLSWQDASHEQKVTGQEVCGLTQDCTCSYGPALQGVAGRCVSHELPYTDELCTVCSTTLTAKRTRIEEKCLGKGIKYQEPRTFG